jgi:hypothetical protein
MFNRPRRHRRDGESKPVPGQLDVIDMVPGEKGYNDFRQVWNVRVPKSYVANEITDTRTLLRSGYKLEKTSQLINMPIVPDKSHASRRFKGGKPELQRAWYRSKVATYFVFDEAPLSVLGDSVPTSPIYDGFTVSPGQPNGDENFQMERNPTRCKLTILLARFRAINHIHRCGCALSTTARLGPRWSTLSRQ